MGESGAALTARTLTNELGGSMMSNDTDDLSTCSRLLTYDPETGLFRWRVKNGNKVAGSAALTYVSAKGYLTGTVDRRHVKAHRVAWLLTYGYWPTGQLDHINGDKSDNRIVNLRDADPTIQARNFKKFSTNTTGCTGVYLHESGRWQSRVQIAGRAHTSLHDSREGACRHRRELIADPSLGFSSRHGGVCLCVLYH
jgi:hypothetical protein